MAPPLIPVVSLLVTLVVADAEARISMVEEELEVDVMDEDERRLLLEGVVLLCVVLLEVRVVLVVVRVDVDVVVGIEEVGGVDEVEGTANNRS